MLIRNLSAKWCISFILLFFCSMRQDALIRNGVTLLRTSTIKAWEKRMPIDSNILQLHQTLKVEASKYIMYLLNTFVCDNSLIFHFISMNCHIVIMLSMLMQEHWHTHLETIWISKLCMSLQHVSIRHYP